VVAFPDTAAMVTKDAFAVFRADKQIQRSIHDFAFRLQTRKFSRLSDQVLIYVDVGAGHVLTIHQYQRIGCMHIELSRIELTAAEGLFVGRADWFVRATAAEEAGLGGEVSGADVGGGFLDGGFGFGDLLGVARGFLALVVL